MSDDLVPEEKEQDFTRLLTALRSASQSRAQITAEEQAQIVARVRDRLANTAPVSTLPDTGAFTQQRSSAPHLPAKRARKSTRLVVNLLVALVVIGLIVGSWALFRAYPPAIKTPVSTTVSESGPVAVAQAGGLLASMHVLIGGPYFLSELLPVDISLANHTSKPVMLLGTNRTADLCFSSALMVQLTGGGNPSFPFPKLEVACTLPAFITEVQPGQTLTIHQYVPLTRSGGVTLTMGPSSHHRASPLDGHWPAVHIQVNPKVPQNRALLLQNHERQVVISVPAGAKAHLLYMQTITCENYGGSLNVRWTPLATNVLDEPACPTPHPHWEYIVSAPGFTIVSGSQ